MAKNTGPGIPGTTPDRTDTKALRSKTDEELLEAIDSMLSRPAEEIDTDFVDACLDILQDRAPMEEGFDPAAARARLEAENPELFAPTEPAARPKGRKRGGFAFRYAGVLAASLLCLVLTANAFGMNPVQAFLKWVDDTIQVYSNPSGLMVLPPDDPSEYHSLDEALEANGAGDADRISWVPKDYLLTSVTVRELEKVIYYSARYESEDGAFVVRIAQFKNLAWSGTVERESDGEIYIHNNREYYLVDNYNLLKAGWENGSFSYVISGQISENELKEIINSVNTR